MAEAVEPRVGEFNAKELANTTWAFALAGRSDAQLFAVLARAVKSWVGEFSVQDFANTAWMHHSRDLAAPETECQGQVHL